MAKRAAIYARVSTDEQGKGYSLPTQLEAGRKYAAERGYVVVAEFSDDYTGTALDRPALNELRALVERGAIDVAICYEVDRLARKMVYHLLIEEEFKKHGVNVEYVLGNYESTPEGQLMKQFRGMMAEFERAKIIERSVRGKRGRAQAGNVHPAPFAPYGYRYISEPHKGRFEVVEAEAEIVRSIFRWYVAGDETGRRLGAGEIAAKLSDLNVPTRADLEGDYRWKRKMRPGAWHRTTVSGILRNEMYAGTWYWNKRKRTGQTTCVLRPSSEWVPVSVPAIISRDLWEAAREQAERNKTFAKRNRKYTYLLQGLLTCSRCRLRFGARSDKRRGAERPYYQCGGMRLGRQEDYAEKLCHWGLRADITDALVWDKLKYLLKNPELLLTGARQHLAKADDGRLALQERHQTLAQQIGDLDRQRERLFDLYATVDGLSKDALQKKLGEIDQRQQSLGRERADLEHHLQEQTVKLGDLDAAKRCCETIARGIDRFTAEDRRLVLERFRVTGEVIRGERKGEDMISLTGRIPSTVPDSNDASVTITPMCEVPVA